MTQLRFRDQVIIPQAGDTVLDSLLRAGVPVGHSCRAGACQSCLLRAVEGTPEGVGQAGLRDPLRARGYFLACITPATTDLTIGGDEEDGLRVPARVLEMTMLTADVLRLRLQPEKPLPYRPGQFIHIVRDDGLTRSYSLASLPERDPYLELHVRRVEGGQMSGWLASRSVGDSLTLRGPAGDCFYVAGRADQPLLLIGIGTGLAPLYGIARDAVEQGHQGPIHIVHGARTLERLYYVQELIALCAAHPAIRYVPCVLQAPAAAVGIPPQLYVGSITDLLTQQFPKLTGFRAYLCGDAGLVTTLRRQVFMAGVARRDIAADAFVTAPNLIR